MKLKRALGFILMIMVVMLYGCGSGGENKSAKITSVNLETTGVTVDVGSVVELPKFAVASWNDGSETSVGIIWDKTTVDTSKVSEGVVYTGTVTGWDGKIVYTVTVIEGQEEYITEAYLISNTATVDVGSNFTLPTKAMVKWSIGTETEAAITWNKAADTSKEGTYKFTGKVEGYDAGNLIYTLIVKKDITPKITSVYLPTSSNTVRQNSVFNLPTTGKAVWSNGEVIDIALTWDKAADTSKLGTTIYEATATGTTFKVQYSLTVVTLGDGILVPKTLTLELETVTVDVDSEYELPKYGKVTMSDGAIKTVELKWNNTTVDTSVEGPYIYVASYTENKVTVTKVMTLVVGGEVKIEKLTLLSNEVTVAKGAKYTLPVTATAVYTDGTESEVVLTWDKKADTSKEGKYTFTGTAKETTKTVILTVTVGPGEVTITELSVTPNKSTVLPGATFTLPATGTAVLSNNTTKEVDLTWDKEVDTSEEGTYTFIGKTSGSMLEVTYTLIVDENAVKELQSLTLTPKSASVALNATYTLPAKGTATYTDGKTEEVTLTWDKKADTSKEGTFTYTASYTENSKTVKATFALTVTTEKTVTGFTISKVDDIAGIGTVYTLPKTGTITYADETTEEVTLTWDKSVNTAVAGKYTFTGTNTKAGTLKVTFVLTVKTVNTPVLTMSDISNVKAGDTIEVAVNASFFTKTVAAIDVRLNYDTTMLKGLDDATMVVSGMKIVKHIGSEQDVSVVLDTPTVISGTLFKVKFKVLKDGNTSIKFAEGTEFLGSGAEKIAMDTTDTGEVGVGIITDNSTLTLSDWTGTTNDTAEVTVKAEGFTETSLGFDITLNYDTKYLTALKEVTIINSDLWNELMIVKEIAPGKILISLTTNKTEPIVLNGDLFKVKFKSTGVATKGTTVSFGEVRVANSTDGYQNSVTTIDTANVVVNQGITTTGTFEIADATGTYPGYATVVLSGKDFKEEASGVEFILNYDSNYLEVENVSTDVILTGALASARIIPIATTAGKLKIALEIDNKTFMANGDLVKIKFKTKKSGKSGLSFANVDLGNAAASGKMEATTTDTANVTVDPIEVKATSVELTASSTSFVVGGSTTLTAVVKDANGNVMSGEAADIYNGTSKVGSSTYSFSSSTAGTYTFTAKSGTLASTAVTITVNGIVENTEYYWTNKDGKVGKNKTITGLSDWTEDMKIAQGAANDAPRSWMGFHEYPDPDLYDMFAAWDDKNLYMMVEIPNIDGADTIDNDKSYAGSQFLPMGWAINTGKRKAGTGSMKAGNSVWSKKELFTFDNGGIDTLIMHHPRVNIGKPSIFTTDAEGYFSYDATNCIDFKLAGITRNVYFNESVSKNMWAGVNADGSLGGKVSTDPTTYKYVDLKAAGKKMTAYQITVPLTALGIDKAYLESNGIGVLVFSTYGESMMDSIPWDQKAMMDNVTKPYSAANDGTSMEKEDKDSITVPLAKIGKK